MFVDLEEILGEGYIGRAGTGGCKMDTDGTWTAWAVLTDLDGGVYARGASQSRALQALELKLKAVGHIASAALEAACARYEADKTREGKAYAERLMGLIKGDDGPSAFDEPAPKKPEGDN